MKWYDRVENSAILKKCNIIGIQTILAKKQLRWADHVLRMDEHRLPKRVLYGQLPNFKCSVRCPLLCYKDKLKDNFKCFNFNLKYLGIPSIKPKVVA